MGPSSVVLALLLPAFSSPGWRERDKDPIPGISTRAKLSGQLKSLYQSVYSKTDAAPRKELSEKLLGVAEGTSDANQRFVLLTESRDLAASAGDVDSAFALISMIADQYDTRSAGPEWTSAAQKLSVLRKAKTATDLSRQSSSSLRRNGLKGGRGRLSRGFRVHGRSPLTFLMLHDSDGATPFALRPRLDRAFLPG